MDRQRRSRYVLAVYLVVLSLAVILILAGLFFTTSPDWKSVWINLGTGLLGVVAPLFRAGDLMDFKKGECNQPHTL